MYCTIVLTKHLIIAEFICNDNAQCNGHGDCDDGQCNCESEWNVKPDCSGNIHCNTVILCDTLIPKIMSIFASWKKLHGTLLIENHDSGNCITQGLGV